MKKKENTTGDAAGLTQKQAASLLKEDLANLGKKVKAGKPLNASERNLLQSATAGEAASPVEYVSTIVELAEVLGVTRKTLQRWRNLPGCPEPRPDGRWHVPSWRAFKKQHQGEGEEGGEINQAQAKARQILLQNERLEMRILKEKGELIPRLLAKQIFSRLVISAKTRTFASVPRIITLVKTAADETAAAEEIRKEFVSIWKAMEQGEWLQK